MTTLSRSLQKQYDQILIAYEKQHFEKAIQLSKILLKAVPDHVLTLTQLSRLYEKTNQYDNAAEVLEKLIILDPKEVSHFSNLGLVYQNINQVDKAQAMLDKALALNPRSPSALLNYGFVAYDMAEFEKAETSYRKIFSISPTWARPHYNLALLLLTQGRYEEAWKEFEYRLNSPEWAYLKSNIKLPFWQGEDLRNKTLLVHSEQGFGDMIQFIRFLQQVKKPDNEIIIELHPPIYNLFKDLDCIDKAIIVGEPLPVFDYHISLLSLPFITKQHTELTEKVPYLHSDPEKKKHWHQKLASIKKRKVGICWSGNPQNKINHRRSCNLQEMLPYYLFPEIQLINLNKDTTAEEKAYLAENKVLDFFDEITDFSDTAALIDNLDLIITIDTSVSHLCGALGKPTLLMLYHFPEWRYLLDKHYNPWYPTMKIFRQSSSRAWADVFSNIHDELKLWLQ